MVVSGPSGSQLIVPGGALSGSPSISLTSGRSFPLPGSMVAAGPAIKAEPAGLTFARAGVLAIPYYAFSAETLEQRDQFQIFALSENGKRSAVPVLGFDDERGMVYAAVSHFTTFQAAVPVSVQGTFGIVPMTSPLVQQFYPLSISVTSNNNDGLVTYALGETTQVYGDTVVVTEPVETLPSGVYEIAPGVTLDQTGLISGSPTTLGTWAFTVTATDTAQPTPNTDTISLTLTVVDRDIQSLPGTTADDEILVQRDDSDNVFVLRRNGVRMNLHRLPADSTQAETTLSWTGGTAPAMAVSPDGTQVVVAYERMVGLSLGIGVNDLMESIIPGEDLSADNISFDLSGNGTPNVTVTFATEGETFQGTDLEMQNLMDALNAEFANQSSPTTASAHPTFNGIMFVDEGANVIRSAGQNSLPGLLVGGDANSQRAGEVSQGFNPLNQRIYGVEIDVAADGSFPATLTEFRVDADPRIAPALDPETTTETTTLEPQSKFMRQALRPGVAFALDHAPPPAEGEVIVVDPDAEPEPILYCISYEMKRNLDISGRVRSDVYARWRQYGGGSLSDEIRLDDTDDAGISSGVAPKITGTATGATIMWIERGNNNANTNGTDADGNAILGSKGDLAVVVLTPPDPLATEPQVIEAAAPVFLNDEALTSAVDFGVGLGQDNRLFVAWAETDDTAQSTDGTGIPPIAGAKANSSLRVAEISGTSASTTWLADQAPLTSTVHRPSVAVSLEGEVTVGWIEAFSDRQRDGYIRRFSAPAVPIDNVAEIAWPVEFILFYMNDNDLALSARKGSELSVVTFITPVEEVVEGG